MTKKELCEKVFQDLFNGNYEKGKAIVLLQKHLGAKNLEETQKNLQTNLTTENLQIKYCKYSHKKQSIMSFTYNGLILCTNTSKKQKRNRELFFSVFFYV